MGAHATTEELIARAQEQIARLTAKANADAISQLPQVKAFDTQIAELNNNALKWKRWGTEASSKIVSFQKRVDEWIERGNKADAWLADYKVELADLKKQREAIVMAEVSKMS
jgi:chromosome segregation ATPase